MSKDLSHEINEIEAKINEILYSIDITNIKNPNDIALFREVLSNAIKLAKTIQRIKDTLSFINYIQRYLTENPNITQQTVQFLSDLLSHYLADISKEMYNDVVAQFEKLSATVKELAKNE